ncbi:MAG: hypothetical protein ACLPTF_04655 [Steroidobacteraceae bacterium]
MSTSMSKDLDKVRAAAQALHGAISDAAVRRGGAVRADFEAVAEGAKSIKESVKATMGVQNEATKKYLKEAVTDFEAVQTHAAEALKSFGQAFQASIRQTLADARASVQKVSEAVAAKRSAESTTRK